jgi:hypothetical protein
MIKHLINLLFFCSIIISSSGCIQQTARFEILEVKELNNYWAYHAVDKSKNAEITLLSIKNDDCQLNEERIITGRFYDFDYKIVSSIMIEKDIYIQLGRGQTIDGFMISGNGNYPYLILESCNGFLKSTE